MVHPRSEICKEIFNYSAKFNPVISRPHQANLRELLLGAMISGSSYLSDIGKVTSSRNCVRKNTERFSQALFKLPTDKMIRINAASLATRFKNEPVLIILDGGDVQKKYAREMENLCAAPDGSNNHEAGNGYCTFSAIAYGMESKNIAPLYHHLYSFKSEDFKSQSLEQQSMIKLIEPFYRDSTQDRIIVEDRGGDDIKKFLYYTKELDCGFIIRLIAGKKSRILQVDNSEGEKDDNMFSVRTLADSLKNVAGNSRSYRNKKLKKKLTSRIAYRAVTIPGHPDLPLNLVCIYTDGFDEPFCLLTDRKIESADDAWGVFFNYRRRWGIEVFFRESKQLFKLERFLVRSFQKIRALVFVLMLVYALVFHLKQKLLNLVSPDAYAIFVRYCKKDYQKKEPEDITPFDLFHWLRDAVFTRLGHFRFWGVKSRKKPGSKPETQQKNSLKSKKW